MSYDRSSSQRRRGNYGASSGRSTLGYWVPLVVSVTAVGFGLAAWIWKERGDGEEEDDYDYDNRRPSPPLQSGGRDVKAGASQSAHADATVPGAYPSSDDPGIVSRVSGALRRSPSPQQILDEAGKRVAAGVAAASAAVGGALSSIREEDKGDYEDHSRWSEEAAGRGAAALSGLSQTSRSANGVQQSKQRTVAIVLSAEDQRDHADGSYMHVNASLLSHLPEDIGSQLRLFVLIYAPHLQQHPLSTDQAAQPATSTASSFSNIGHEDLHTPDEDAEKPVAPGRPLGAQSNSAFDAVYAQAQTLVSKSNTIMPFTTPTGYLQILRHINPDVVYLQANISGDDGKAAKELSRFSGQVVLVVGDDSGHGGLVDSEDERPADGESGSARWWQGDSSVGRGKGIEMVESLRIGEDWQRRVEGHD